MGGNGVGETLVTSRTARWSSLDGKAAHPDEAAHRDMDRDNEFAESDELTLRYGWSGRRGSTVPCGWTGGTDPRPPWMDGNASPMWTLLRAHLALGFPVITKIRPGYDPCESS